MKCLNSKIITLLICLQLALYPSVVFSAGGLGGWTLSNPIAQGASTLYTGMKNVMINGKNVAKTSTALITPTATQVAKLLARGAGGYALSVAVAQLIGDGIDWVLDPANNQITYNSSAPYQQGIYRQVDFEGNNPHTVCRQTATYFNKTYKSFTVQGTGFYCIFTDGSSWAGAFEATGGQVEGDKKTIPLPTVASKIISNAQNGDSSAKAVTTATAADIVNDAQNDEAQARPIVNQLEQNAVTQADETTANGQTKPNPQTGGYDINLEFPAFCGWAPIVCEAAQSAINFPKTVEQWYTETKTAIKEAWNWFREEPTQPEKEQPIDIDERPLTNPSSYDKNYLNFGGSCPSVESTNIQVGPISVPLSINVTALCDFALKVRPAVLGLAYLTALGIVSSAIRES